MATLNASFHGANERHLVETLRYPRGMQPYAPPDDAEMAARAIRARQKRTRVAIGCMFAALLFGGALVMVWTFLFRADSDPIYVDHGTSR
jgi:hypothetical protein